MYKNKVLILEGEKPTLNRFNALKNIIKVNSFIILNIIIFILFIIICILLLILKKNTNYIIELSQKNNILNQNINKQFDFIE